MLEELKPNFAGDLRNPSAMGWGQPVVSAVLKNAVFYSSGPTAADPVLLGETLIQQTDRPVEDRFTAACLTLIRTIGTDDRLAEQLVEELQRRNIDLIASPKIPHIALISEWGHAVWTILAAYVRRGYETVGGSCSSKEGERRRG